MIPQKIISKIVIVAIVFVSGAFSGYSYCKRSNDKGVIKQQNKDAEEVMRHEDQKITVRKNVDEKIKSIRKIIDPSGCLDANSPDDYFNRLLDADSTAKSSFD